MFRDQLAAWEKPSVLVVSVVLTGLEKAYFEFSWLNYNEFAQVLEPVKLQEFPHFFFLDLLSTVVSI